MDLRAMRALLIRMGLKDFAVKLSHTRFARVLQGINYSAGLRKHEKEIQQVFEMLADDFSRETLRAVIHASKTGDYSRMKEFNVRPQYFLKDICVPADREIYVDGGGGMMDMTYCIFCRIM